MRTRIAGVVLALATILAAGACSGDDPAPPAAEPSAEPAVPTYDGSLAPSAAVLALVPDAATTMRLTDYDEVRDALGITDLATTSPVDQQDAFWARADAETPLLNDGLLRPVEDQLRGGYGLSQLDVAWQARFADADGTELGWVLAMRPGTAMDSVARAVADGVGELAGATVRHDDLLVVSGTTDDGSTSWAADPGLTDLVGLGGVSWYVERGCVPPADAGVTAPDDFEPLDAYSVQLESSLVTARLGADRGDLFPRMRLSTESPEFAAAYEGGVSDPLTGRIGFRTIQPVAAVDLVRQRRLPLTVCAS